jgi:hypothetical protein
VFVNKLGLGNIEFVSEGNRFIIHFNTLSVYNDKLFIITFETLKGKYNINIRCISDEESF